MRRVLTVLLLGGASVAIHAEPEGQLLERLQRLGEHSPQRALQRFNALPAPVGTEQRRAWALARAVIATGGTNDADEAAAAAAAVTAAEAIAPSLAEADKHFLQALKTDQAGSGQAGTLARQALAGYEAWCQSREPVCEFPQRFRMLELLGRQAWMQRSVADANLYAKQAWALAEAAGQPGRQALAQSQLALSAALTEQRAESDRHMKLALELANSSGDAEISARVAIAEALTLDAFGEPGRALRALHRALAAATAADARRLVIVVQANLADVALHAGQPTLALESAEAGLRAAKEMHDGRIERVLLANRLVARVRVGQTVDARSEVDVLLAAWSADRDIGSQLALLRAYGDALEAVGDLDGALAAYHRERELAQQPMRGSRSHAITDLESRNEVAAQRQRIEALERDNDLKAAELQSRALVEQFLMLSGAAVAIALLVLAPLALRVRRGNAALTHSQRGLRMLSERDPLTRLANRRYMHQLLQARTRSANGFRGGLLLIDIDHFKQVNDHHGHSAGDAVIVEVARRLQATLRDDDAVARWGGEEFLVLVPVGATSGEVARRVLQAIAGEPMPLPGGAEMRVTVSIGHADLPLSDEPMLVTLETAVHLVDKALYRAKALGRNRAVGVHHSNAASNASLRKQVEEFDGACQDGRVQLHVQCGPNVAG
ncbi:GGDEF domain-containing protein [Roseateles sp.]|uniref:GGDEF domain-containing protein n=1 Tax=Roseateles sp. TaxID=1971397 RepID=UPI0032661D9C